MSAEQQPPIKVVITDDHHLVIEGLRKVLDPLPQIEVIASYTRAGALLKGLHTAVPDVLLLDLQLPDQPAYEIVEDLIRDYPDMRILILSAVESHYYIKDMINQGCQGYLLKSATDQDTLATAIQEVYDGSLFLDPSIRADLLQEMLQTKRKKNSLQPRITAREKEVLALIVQEFDNQEIAKKLCISSRTVENHRYNLLQKLDVKNSVGLVRVALQMGLLDQKPL